MKIDIKKYRRASQEAENRVRQPRVIAVIDPETGMTEEEEKKLEIIRVLIETGTRMSLKQSRGKTESVTRGFGGFVNHKLLKYVRGKKVGLGDYRLYPTHKSRLGFKLACLKELKQYRTEKERQMFKELAEVPLDELRAIARQHGAFECAKRYGNEKQLEKILRKPVLNPEDDGARTDIEITGIVETDDGKVYLERKLEFNRRRIAAMARETKKRLGKVKRVALKKAKRKLVHGGMSASDYAASILSFSQFAEERHSAPGEEKKEKKAKALKKIKVDMLKNGHLTFNGHEVIPTEFNDKWLKSPLKTGARFRKFIRNLCRETEQQEVNYIGRVFKANGLPKGTNE